MALKSFGDVQVAVAKKPTKTGTRDRIVVDGVRKLGALKIMKAMIVAAEETISDSIKLGPMTEHFIEKGVELGKCPESYEGIEGEHEASMGLRKRSSRSPLTEAEVAVCKENNIPVEKNVLVQETYIINPELLNDAKVMKQIEMALAKADLLKYFQKQEEEFTMVTTDNSLNAVFRAGTVVAQKTLGIVGVMAFRPKYHLVNGDVAPAIKDVADILGLADDMLKAKIMAAANDPDSVLNPKKEYTPKKGKKAV